MLPRIVGLSIMLLGAVFCSIVAWAWLQFPLPETFAELVRTGRIQEVAVFIVGILAIAAGNFVALMDD